MKHNPVHRSREAISNAHLSIELLDAIVRLPDYNVEGCRLLLQPSDLGDVLLRISALRGILHRGAHLGWTYASRLKEKSHIGGCITP
jgi:hypothetical protein